MRRKLAIIAIVAAIAGVINAAVIFNVSHQYDYIDEAISVVGAMSESTKTIVVDNEEDYQLFSRHTQDYVVYKKDNLPDSATVVWYIMTTNSNNWSIPPDDLLSGYRVLSEAAREYYLAYELEKL